MSIKWEYLGRGFRQIKQQQSCIISIKMAEVRLLTPQKVEDPFLQIIQVSNYKTNEVKIIILGSSGMRMWSKSVKIN